MPVFSLILSSCRVHGREQPVWSCVVVDWFGRPVNEQPIAWSDSWSQPCLQRYLDALPSDEYFGKGYQVVATDATLRLNRSSTKEPAMGAGVM